MKKKTLVQLRHIADRIPKQCPCDIAAFLYSCLLYTSHIHTRSYNFYTFGSSQFFQLFPGLGIQVETKDFIAPFSAQLMARIYFYILHSQFLSFIQRLRQRKELECIRLYGYPPILFFRFRLFAGRQKACKQQKTNNGE